METHLLNEDDITGGSVIKATRARLDAQNQAEKLAHIRQADNLKQEERASDKTRLKGLINKSTLPKKMDKPGKSMPAPLIGLPNVTTTKPPRRTYDKVNKTLQKDGGEEQNENEFIEGNDIRGLSTPIRPRLVDQNIQLHEVNPTIKAIATKSNVSVKAKNKGIFSRTAKNWNKIAQSYTPFGKSVPTLTDESKKRINVLGPIDPTKIIPTDKEIDAAEEAQKQTKPPPKTIDYYNKKYKVKELTQLKNDLIIKLNNAPEAKPDKIAIDTQLAIAHETAAIKLAKLKFDYDKISDVNEDDTKLLTDHIKHALKHGLFGKIISLNTHNNVDRTKSLRKAEEDLKRASAYHETLRSVHSLNPNKDIVDDLRYALELVRHKKKYAEQLGSLMTKITGLESRNPVDPQAVKDVKAYVDALIDANQKVLNIEDTISYRKEPKHFNTPLSAEQATLLKQAKAAMDTLDALIDTIVKKHAAAEAKAKAEPAAKAEATPSFLSKFITRTASPTRVKAESASGPAVVVAPPPSPAKAEATPSFLSKIISRTRTASPTRVKAESASGPAVVVAPPPSPAIEITDEITNMVRRCRELMNQIANQEDTADKRILLRQLAKHLIILVTLINQK